MTPEEFGKAIRFRVRDAEGGLLADVMLGKEEASEVAAVQQIKQLGTVERNFYVRRRKRANMAGARAIAAQCANRGMARSGVSSLPQERLVAVSAKGATEEALARLCSGLPDGSWDKPGGAGWLEGFSRLQPEDVSRDTAINFDTASTLHLSLWKMASLLRLKMSALPLCFGRARALGFHCRVQCTQMMPVVKRLVLGKCAEPTL